MTTSASSKSSPAPKPKSSEPKEATLTRFQAFTTTRLHRRQVSGAKYNPRTLSEEARKKLQRSLRDFGLLEPVIWNKTTGLLVGGHQRLAALDALEGSDDYLLEVAAVELTEKQEREANVALNNPALQGEYDQDLLAELLKTPELDLGATGFDLADVQVMFDDPDLASIFVPNEPTKAALSDVEKQQKAAETKKRLQKERGEDNPAYADRQDTECIAYVVFRTRAEREGFAERMGYGPDERYLDGARIVRRLSEGAPEPGRSDMPVNEPRASSPDSGGGA